MHRVEPGAFSASGASRKVGNYARFLRFGMFGRVALEALALLPRAAGRGSGRQSSPAPWRNDRGELVLSPFSQSLSGGCCPTDGQSEISAEVGLRTTHEAVPLGMAPASFGFDTARM